jgi:hypothetical protein
VAFRSAKRLRDGVDARHNAGHDESSIPSLGIIALTVSIMTMYAKLRLNHSNMRRVSPGWSVSKIRAATQLFLHHIPT